MCANIGCARLQIGPNPSANGFLSGFHKAIKAIVPEALPPFGRASLRDFLGHYPHTPRSEYTEPQQTNLKAYELAICELVLAGIVMIFANVNR